MPGRPWVLAISKRAASMCATQSALFAAGLEVVTATNLKAARAAIRSLPVEAVVICHHSWTAEEQEQLIADLSALRPKLSYLLRCPGCVAFDGATDKPGHLTETLPLTQLINAIHPAPRRK